MSRHRFHGDPERFAVTARFVADTFGRTVHHIADVAGGQGMLARVLAKRYNYAAEVVDPRGWTLTGVDASATAFDAHDASYYDLIIGLHPDEATRAVVEAATVRPVIVVPCCNFWDASRKLGRDALLDAIAEHYEACGVTYERVALPFKGPKNLALVSRPPADR
jgi:hypothetical protein